MSLEKKDIVSNMKKYIDTSKKFKFLTPELEDLLGTEFITAPASTMTKLHNAFEGGLVDHILRVMKYAYKINVSLEDEMQLSMESLVKVVYLHQIGKTNLYVPEKSKWHRENLGRMYDYNEDVTSMKVGERSAYYALKCGIKLTDDEYVAIINHDKIDDAQSEWHNSTIGDILKIAIRLAILEEKMTADAG